MKYIHSFLILALILIISGCQKSDNSTKTVSNNSKNTFTCDIIGYKGAPFKADSALCLSKMPFDTNLTVISAFNGTGAAYDAVITMKIRYLQPGVSSVFINDTNSNVSAMIEYYKNAFAEGFTFNRGTINFTENSTMRIKGTFFLVCDKSQSGDTINVFNGVFSIMK